MHVCGADDQRKLVKGGRALSLVGCGFDNAACYLTMVRLYHLGMRKSIPVEASYRSTALTRQVTGMMKLWRRATVNRKAEARSQRLPEFTGYPSSESLLSVHSPLGTDARRKLRKSGQVP